jgi:hypothetical protein
MSHFIRVLDIKNAMFGFKKIKGTHPKPHIPAGFSNFAQSPA